jgi:plasmid stabilization system protein ParE
MKWTLRLHPLVQSDIREIMRWYDERDPGRGPRFEMALTEAFQRIVENPQAYACIVKQYRRARVKGYPHGVYFELGQGVIYVVAILHAKEAFKKLYWRG